MWSGGKGHMPSSSLLVPVAEDMSRKRHPLTPLEVYIELCLTKKPLEKFLTYLFRWVEQRKASIHLCCKKMKIISMSKENMKTVLRMVKLDCVQMVKLSFTQKLSTLAQFAPLLGQMSNVQCLILSRIRGSAVEEQDHQDLLQLTSQILQLRNLRDLRMEAPFFLEGRLDQMLRWGSASSWLTVDTMVEYQGKCLICCSTMKRSITEAQQSRWGESVKAALERDAMLGTHKLGGLDLVQVCMWFLLGGEISVFWRFMYR